MQTLMGCCGTLLYHPTCQHSCTHVPLHLSCPFRVFGDSQLMIHFLKFMFKWPQYPSIHWALEDARAAEQVQGQLVAYHHVTRDTNCIVDNVARRALDKRATITFWHGKACKDALGNQLQDIYQQQGMKLWLDWASLPELFDWTTNQPDPQPDITAATVFGQRYAIRVAQSCLWEAQCETTVWFCEVSNMDQG